MEEEKLAEVEETLEAVEELDLHEQHEKKAAEMQEKYHDAIYAIAMKHGVDMGVGFDMLKAVCRGGDYAEGIELDKEELMKDYNELVAISEAIVSGK